MSGKTTKAATPFADTAERKKDAGRSATAAARRREAYGRLIANGDFKDFMFEALYTLCAFEHDLRDTSEFERGIRAAGSFIRRSLLVADEAPKFFADLDRRYYAGVQRGIIEAEKKNNQEETRRPQCKN